MNYRQFWPTKGMWSTWLLIKIYSTWLAFFQWKTLPKEKNVLGESQLCFLQFGTKSGYSVLYINLIPTALVLFCFVDSTKTKIWFAISLLLSESGEEKCSMFCSNLDWGSFLFCKLDYRLWLHKEIFGVPLQHFPILDYLCNFVKLFNFTCVTFYFSVIEFSLFFCLGRHLLFFMGSRGHINEKHTNNCKYIV